MNPLAHWELYVQRMSVAEFRASFPYPFLVLATTRPLSPVDGTRGLTLDRAIMPGADQGPLAATIADYRVAPIRRMSLKADETISIGCSSQCDIQINDRSVSKVHAHMVRKPDGWHVIDASSLMGTRVNDEEPGPAPLEPGDRITVGVIDLVFLTQDGLYHLVQQLSKLNVPKPTPR